MTYLTPRQRDAALGIMRRIEEPRLQKEVSFRLFRELAIRAIRNFDLTAFGVSEMIVVSRAQAIVDQLMSDWIMTLKCQSLFDVNLFRTTVALFGDCMVLSSSPELVAMGQGKSQIKLFEPPNWLVRGQHALISDWLEYERSIEFDLQREAYAQLVEMIDEELVRQPLCGSPAQKAEMVAKAYEQTVNSWKKLHSGVVGLDDPDINVTGVYLEALDTIQAFPSLQMSAISAGGSRQVSFIRELFPPVV